MISTAEADWNIQSIGYVKDFWPHDDEKWQDHQSYDNTEIFLFLMKSLGGARAKVMAPQSH